MRPFLVFLMFTACFLPLHNCQLQTIVRQRREDLPPLPDVNGRSEQKLKKMLDEAVRQRDVANAKLAVAGGMVDEEYGHLLSVGFGLIGIGGFMDVAGVIAELSTVAAASVTTSNNNTENNNYNENTTGAGSNLCDAFFAVTEANFQHAADIFSTNTNIPANMTATISNINRGFIEQLVSSRNAGKSDLGTNCHNADNSAAMAAMLAALSLEVVGDALEAVGFM